MVDCASSVTTSPLWSRPTTVADVDLLLRMLTEEAVTVPLTAEEAAVLLSTVMVSLAPVFVPVLVLFDEAGLVEERYDAFTKPTRPVSDWTFFQPEYVPSTTTFSPLGSTPRLVAEALSKARRLSASVLAT